MSHLTAISPEIFWPYFAALAVTLLAMIALARKFRSCRDWRLLFALGPICIAIPMAVFGADHLSDPKTIMQIVPEWMPGRLFWTYFVGICLIAAALSIVLRIQLRLSSMLLGIMLIVFVVLMHIPNALAKPGDRLRWIVAARDLSFGCGASPWASSKARKPPPENASVQIMQFLIAAIAIFFSIESLQMQSAYRAFHSKS